MSTPDSAGNKAGGQMVPGSSEEQALEPGRAAFEAWFSEKGKLPEAIRRNGEGYALAAAESAWIAYKAAWDCQQAEIDRLMLEHCPEEMTPRQMGEWARHQVGGPVRDEAALGVALRA